MTPQRLVGEHPESAGVAKRRSSARRVTGRLSHQVEGGADDLLPSGHMRQRFGVEPAVTGDESHDRFTVDREHERLHDGGDIAADRGRRIHCRLRACRESRNFYVQPVLAGGGDHPVRRCRVHDGRPYPVVNASEFPGTPMSNRAITSITLTLALVACSPGVADPITDDPPTTSSSVADTVPSAAELVYGYAPGTRLDYGIEVTQDIGFDADGDAEGFGDAALPIDADLVTESTGTAAYSVAAGRDGDTFALGIVASFPDTRVAGTVNGDTIDNLEEGGVEADLARIDPVDVTLTVNPFGRVMEGDVADTAELGANLAALTGLTSNLFTSPVGPVFPVDRTLAVGDTWEIMTTRSGPSGPVAVRSLSEIVDFVGGVYVIDTTTVTDAYAVDFSDRFRELFLGFAQLEEGAEIPPDIRESLDTIRFSISVDEATSTERVEFDANTGIVRSATRSAGLRLAMTFRSPVETGEVTGFDIRLDIDQTAVFTLIG